MSQFVRKQKKRSPIIQNTNQRVQPRGGRRLRLIKNLCMYVLSEFTNKAEWLLRKDIDNIEIYETKGGILSCIKIIF
jgi:hypothetical protein